MAENTKITKQMLREIILEAIQEESKCPCSEKGEETVEEGIVDFLKGKKEPAKRPIPQVRTSPIYASKLAKNADEYQDKLKPVRQANLALEEKA